MGHWRLTIVIFCLFSFLSACFATELKLEDAISQGQKLFKEGKKEEAAKVINKSLSEDPSVSDKERTQFGDWIYFTFILRETYDEVAGTPTTAVTFRKRFNVLRGFYKKTPKNMREKHSLNLKEFYRIYVKFSRHKTLACRLLDKEYRKAIKLVDDTLGVAKIKSSPDSLVKFKTRSATILYFNDAHQLAPVKDELSIRGGVARVKTVVDAVRKENNETVVIFGGDLAGGTLFGGVFKGLPQVEAFNKIPIDAASFGQHDFDFGFMHTLTLIENSTFTWFSSNLRRANGSLIPEVYPYYIYEVGGLKIGLMGLTTAMETTTRDGRVQEIPLEKAVPKTILKLEDEGADVIVAVTQMPLSDNVELLKEYPSIIAALTEEQYEERSNIHYVGDRPIIAPCGNQGSIVRLDLKVDKDGLHQLVRVYPLDESVAENPQLAKLAKKYHDEMDKKLGQTLAYLSTDLDGMLARKQESPAANLITDAFRHHYKADLALIQGGGIRASVKKGKFTRRDAWALLPFGNKLCLIEMSGKDVLAALNHGLVGRQKLAGNLLQLSGASYEVSAEGQIDLVLVKGRPLALDERYRVALPSYLLAGGGDFHMFKRAKTIVSASKGEIDAEVVAEYCKKLAKLVPRLEKRIVFK